MDDRLGNGSFAREDKLVVEGQLYLEFAIAEEEDDRIEVGGYDLHDLIASQFSDTDNYRKRQRLGRFRVTVERMAHGEKSSRSGSSSSSGSTAW